MGAAGHGGLFGGGGSGGTSGGTAGAGGIIIIYTSSTAAAPFVYYDFSAKPQPNKSPEEKWLPQNSAHRLQDMLQPTILASPPASFRFDFDRHPPAPPKGPEFIFPNIVATYPYEVLIDATSSGEGSTTSGTSLSYTNLTVGTNPNRALAAIAFVPSGSNATVVTATWDSGGSNQVMTQYDAYTAPNGVGIFYLFGLANPVNGNKTLKFSWTNSSHLTVDALSFYNVNQTAPFYNVTNADALSGSTNLTLNFNSGLDGGFYAGVALGGASGYGGIIENSSGAFDGYTIASFTGGALSNLFSVETGNNSAAVAMAVAAYPAPSNAVLPMPGFVPFDFYRHPPPYVRGPDTIFPNLALGNAPPIPLVDLLRRAADVFYRHPPPYVKGAEFLFPNIALHTAPAVLLPDLLRRAQFIFDRHPPAYYRSSEFRPVNFLLKEIPGPPVVVTTFIRNAPYVLQQVRTAAPALAQVREESAELAQIRTNQPPLTK